MSCSCSAGAFVARGVGFVIVSADVLSLLWISELPDTEGGGYGHIHKKVSRVLLRGLNKEEN